MRNPALPTLPVQRCATCKHPLTATTYVTQGFLGTYIECEFCFAGVDRPDEPELITDTFTYPKPSQPARTLDLIIDKLTGEQE